LITGKVKISGAAMRWLLTTKLGIERADIQRELAPLEVLVNDAAATPMGDEQVFEAEGPRDLPARLEGRRTSVLEVHPDSPVEPYG
jgi:hypothetical protein